MINIEIKQNLSKNIICTWKIKKNIEPEINYKIISCVFFKKEDLYKDITNYINGLSDIIKNYKKNYPLFRLRIYYDNSVIEDLNTILINNNDNHIELYHYHIDLLYNKTSHKGTIGTLIRFLPLFNLEYHTVNTCLILDIDDKIRPDHLELIDYYEKNALKLVYRSRPSYKLLERLIKIKNRYPVVACFIYSIIQLPYKIFSNFFENLYFKQDPKIINNIKKTTILNIYEYGVDEYFINQYYLNYINKKNIKYYLLYPKYKDSIDVLVSFGEIFLYCLKKKYDILFKLNLKIVVNFLKIINIDFYHFYNIKIIDNIKLIDNKLIIDLFKRENINTNLIEIFNYDSKITKLFNQKIINCNKNNLQKLKNYIYYNLKKNYHKRFNLQFEYILMSLNIRHNKNNLIEIVNNNIKKYIVVKKN